jgi:hypothetical protein
LRRPTMEASHEGEMGLRVHVRSFRGHEWMGFILQGLMGDVFIKRYR